MNKLLYKYYTVTDQQVCQLWLHGLVKLHSKFDHCGQYLNFQLHYDG